MAGLVVFDLDFTLWDCGGTWCDCTRPPYRRTGGTVRDARGGEIVLYPDVRAILEYCREEGIIMALASRTDEPGWARELLDLLGVSGYFPHKEIYPGAKTTHLNRIRDQSGIGFESMAFFDDEMRNIRDARSLGVRGIYVEAGLNWNVFRSAFN